MWTYGSTSSLQTLPKKMKWLIFSGLGFIWCALHPCASKLVNLSSSVFGSPISAPHKEQKDFNFSQRHNVASSLAYCRRLMKVFYLQHWVTFTPTIWIWIINSHNHRIFFGKCNYPCRAFFPLMETHTCTIHISFRNYKCGCLMVKRFPRLKVFEKCCELFLVFSTVLH